MPIIRTVSTYVATDATESICNPSPPSGLNMIDSSNQNDSIPPFPAFPCAARYVAVGSLAEGFTRVCRSIDTREAVSLVIGPPGTGKSLLCGLLAQRYRESHDVVVLGDTPLEDRAAFQRHLLHHIGIDFSKVVNGDLHLALIDHLCRQQSPSAGLLLIIDEAQALSPEVIEAIRVVTNIMHQGQPRVSCVLCGGMKLDEILVDRSLEAFTQRIATRCYLHPMNSDETRQYVFETISSCGAQPERTISPEAIAAIHHACGGVPRLINQMMTLAIDCAAEQKQQTISEPIVNQAWSQLQQLPSPITDEPKISESSPVEFGELSDSAEFAEWGGDETEQVAAIETGEAEAATEQAETPAPQQPVETEDCEPVAVEQDSPAEIETFEPEPVAEAEPEPESVPQIEVQPVQAAQTAANQQPEPTIEAVASQGPAPTQEPATPTVDEPVANGETQDEAADVTGAFVPPSLQTPAEEPSVAETEPQTEAQPLPAAEADPSATPAVAMPELPAGVHIEMYEPEVEQQFAPVDTASETAATELEFVQAEVAQPEAAPDVDLDDASDDLAALGILPQDHGIEAAVAEIAFKAPTMPTSPPVRDESAPTPPVSPPPALLFGEFDQEEEVEIGNEFTPRTPARQAVPPADLEKMLHQELVGVSPAPEQEASADEIIIEDDNGTIEYIEEPQQQRQPQPEPVEEIIEIAEETHAVVAEQEDPVRFRIHEDPVRDDRDILVIEEEVDLRDQTPPTRIDSQDQTISVDFQAMLDRMRSGS